MKTIGRKSAPSLGTLLPIFSKRYELMRRQFASTAPKLRRKESMAGMEISYQPDRRGKPEREIFSAFRAPRRKCLSAARLSRVRYVGRVVTESPGAGTG